MTALNSHIEHNMDESKIQEIKSLIHESGVKYIYYQVVTLGGKLLAKVVPATQLERNLAKGIQFHRTAISDMQCNRFGELMGGGTQAAEFTAMPDLDTFQVLPWDRSVGAFFCRVYEPGHRAEVGGQALSTDPRGLLIRTHEAFTERQGMRLKSGCEPEMSWLGDSMKINPRPGASPAYQLSNLELMRPIYQRVIDYASQMGFDMIEGDYEDPYQLELNWMFDTCELTADRLMFYRQICRQVAKEFGVTASFMPKPYTGGMGNGCHHNISLWRGAVNTFEEEGRTDLHLSDIARYSLGGLLKHTPGAMLIMASTVNSYKRFWDVGQFAPSQVNWGMDNKTCSVRLSAIGRLEYKLPDASVNPYLSHVALLAAIENGIEHKLDPGEAIGTSSYSRDIDASARIPLTLGEAVEAFKNNPVIKGAFPEAMSSLYVDLKADEWARYCAAVTDWERDMYKEYLP
ncbi:glutamine synthetase family protein [Litchfieldella rifensis]|uniref:Glutamine synthetase family protein n=1 Tax=Litchfieldella rifensis TaxID=762643 RepID=A0ABV7LTW9_9GAMM